MVKLRAFLTVVLATVLAGSAMAASDTRGSFTPAFARPSMIAGHVPPIAGPVTTLTGPNGYTLAVWVNRLAVACRIARGVGLVDIPVVGIGNQTNGIQDGPDSTDPLGVKGSHRAE